MGAVSAQGKESSPTIVIENVTMASEMDVHKQASVLAGRNAEANALGSGSDGKGFGKFIS